MSSALLYLAIVVIWAGVLVPRWLRTRHADPPSEQQTPAEAAHAEAARLEREEAGPYETASAEPREDLALPAGAASGHAGDTPAAPDRLSGQAAGEDAVVGPAGAEPRGAAPPGPEPPGAEPPDREDGPVPAPRGASPAARRTRILRARRRMLATLAVLTAGAAGLAVAHLAASWVIVPPAFMLAGFLVLLREAAHSDAERTRRRTQLAPAQAQSGAGPQTGASRGAVPAPQAGQAPVAPPEPGLTAQVIDISRRIGGQFYDQYSDAAERAVGD